MTMMMKNWLIRTKQNQILGPVSREKIIELIKSESLIGDDEVTQGNGYWFFIKEIELVQSYIYGEKKQTFNPVSEASKIVKRSEKNELSLLPEQGDLEYPDSDVSCGKSPVIESQVEGTLILNLENRRKDDPAIDEPSNLEIDKDCILPKNEDLSYPESSDKKQAKPKVSSHKPKGKKVENKKSSNSGSKLLGYIFVALAIIIACVSFYYSRVLGKPIFGYIKSRSNTFITLSSLLSDSHAQVVEFSSIKKKNQKKLI